MNTTFQEQYQLKHFIPPTYEFQLQTTKPQS